MKNQFTRAFLVITLVCGLTTTTAWAKSKDADPALWVMRDADTTIYLFGTVHMLPKDVTWFDGAVAKAFNDADELKLEILPVDDPATLGPIIMKYAVDPNGRTMAQKLSPQDHASYVKTLQEVGLPAEQLELMEPWFVGLQAVAVLYANAGYDPKLGSEVVLTEAARKMSKTITAFETPEEQLAILDSTPEAEQLIGLRKLAKQRVEGLSFMAKLIEHWARGNFEEAGRLLNDEMKETPETARLLLTERNIRWAKELKARMERPGVVFVAVGAGHLTGGHSVKNLLIKEGFNVEPVVY